MTSDAVVLELHDLRKRYRQSDPLAVDDVSFHITAGQVFGLLGPNGAGKTTIVKMIAGLVRPDSGSIEVLGSSPGDPRTRAKLGFAPEEPDFPKFLKAPEVLDYFGRLLRLTGLERRRRIPETLQWCGLAGERRQVRQFSKGMKQRLGLGQALLGRPRLVIFDEPTSDLDPAGRRDVRELITKLKSDGVAVLLNSHLLSEVERVSDTVAILDHGRVLAEGAMAAVVPDGRTLEETFIELVQRARGTDGGQHLPSFLTGGVG
jgi:ABC-2 type transport system ATP-binding protein